MNLKDFYILSILFSFVIVSCKSDKSSIPENTMQVAVPVEKMQKEETRDSNDNTQQKEEFKNPIVKEKEPLVEPKTAKQKAITPNSVVAKTEKKKVPKQKDALKKKVKYALFSWDAMEHDFGTIVEGDIIEHTFKFTNTGKTPLEILSVTPSCGCTMPSYPFLSIDPGVSNEIGVTYNSVSKEGPQAATITIVANTDPKTTILKLKGIVNPKPKSETEDIELKKDSLEKVIIPAKEKVVKTGKKVKKDANTKISIKKDEE